MGKIVTISNFALHGLSVIVSTYRFSNGAVGVSGCHGDDLE